MNCSANLGAAKLQKLNINLYPLLDQMMSKKQNSKLTAIKEMRLYGGY